MGINSHFKIYASNINGKICKPDQQISVVLQRRLNEAFEDFTNDILKACDYEPSAGNIPVTVIFLNTIQFVIRMLVCCEIKINKIPYFAVP